MWTTVVAFQEPWEAHMLRGRLAAEGIPAIVALEHHVWTAWHFSTALGGVRVQVPDDRREEAKSVAAACRNGEFAALLEHDFGPFERIHCPHCGSEEYWKRRPLFYAAFAIAVSFMIGPLFPPQGWVYFCEKCQTKYRQPLCPTPPGKWALIAAVSVCIVLALMAPFLIAWLFPPYDYGYLAAVIVILIAARWASRRLSAPEEAEE
jgi:hypothetical protein